MTNPRRFALLNAGGLIILNACNSRLDPIDAPKERPTAATSKVVASSGGTTGFEISNIFPGAPDLGRGDFGGMGGELILPPFDCSNPDFFPLRLHGDADAPPIVEVDGVVEEGGGGAGPVMETEPLTVLLVFDKSGSMGEHWGGKSRWQAGSDAVLLGLDGILDDITMGAIFFPFYEPEIEMGCGVPDVSQAPQIDFDTGRVFKDTWIATACIAQPSGYTPLERALEKADAAIASAGERSLLTGRMRVLLVTDGEPTCGDDLSAIVAFPRKWAENGIDTHVIGLPGSSSAADLLTQIAMAGGTEDYFAPLELGALEEEVYLLLR